MLLAYLRAHRRLLLLALLTALLLHVGWSRVVATFWAGFRGR